MKLLIINFLQPPVCSLLREQIIGLVRRKRKTRFHIFLVHDPVLFVTNSRITASLCLAAAFGHFSPFHSV
jgi:hypothetical protein